MGSCSPADAAKLGDTLLWNARERRHTPFGPLTITEGMCGLGHWPAAEINAVGNLAERDYSVESVAEHLRELVNVAPSLIVRIDCGADWESTECVATVVVGEDRTVAVLPPQTETLPEIPEAQMLGRFLAAITRPQ